MSDDYSSDIRTTGLVSLDQSATGSFEQYADADWYKIALTAGTSYVFSLGGAPQGAGTLADFGGVVLYVYDAQGKAVASMPYTDSYAPSLLYTPSVAGTYFVAANANYSLGSYTLTASLPAADDYSADLRTTGAFDGATAAGVMERPGDVDWIKFHAEAGQLIGFSSTTAGGQLHMETSVYDASGHLIGAYYGYPFKPTASGDYYLALSSGSHVGSYTETLRQLTDDLPAGSFGQLAVGGQFSGAIDFGGDIDRITLAAEAGQAYTLTLATPADDQRGLRFEIYDSDGYSYAPYSPNWADHKTTVRFLADKADTFTIRLSSTSDLSASGLAYTLSLDNPGADDYGNSRDGAPLLALGVPLGGALQAKNDVDLFRTELSAGVTYAFSLGPAAAGTQRQLVLQDSTGHELYTQQYSGSAGFSYTPDKSGSYYLQASDHGINQDESYSISASKTDDDYGAIAASAGRLAVGGQLAGNLEVGGDRDWFAVSLNAGATYWFTLKGAKEGGGTLTPVTYYGVPFRVLDAAGKVVATADNSTGATAAILPFTPGVKGTYYLEVAAERSTGTYTVAARIGETDDYGSDMAHAGTMQAGQALNGKLELATDKDMLKLSVVAGQTYALELKAADYANSSYIAVNATDSASAYVPLRSPYTGHYSDASYQLFEARQTGDYYLTVNTSSTYGMAGGYTLKATPLGFDDYPATVQTTATLAPGGTLHGAIGVIDDHDWIKVHLDAGRTYVFDLHGVASGGGTMDAGTNNSGGMSLLNDKGATLASGSASAASGGEIRVSYIAAASGDFYLDVSGSSTRTGTYTVEATQTSGDLAAPLLLGATIAAGATGVAPRQDLVLTFNETVMLGSGAALKDASGAIVSGVIGPDVKVSGHTVVVPHQNLAPGQTYTLDLPDGSVLDLAGNHYRAPASYSFTTQLPVAGGTAGNDYLVGTGVGATLDGGAGIDTAYYTQKPMYLHIVRNGDGSASVLDWRSGAAPDTLVNVERLMFSDSTMALDIDGNGGQAYRLYQAAFNRMPGVGLGFWINGLDNGVKLETVAQNFIDSPEFKTLYGASSSNADFVNHLYSNVLHRAPLQTGFDFWLHALDAGVPRAQILVNFSESPENHAALQPLIGQGFTYTPYG